MNDMPSSVRTVEDRKDLETFVNIPFRLYPGDSLWVPPLIRDELETFTPRKNPAYEHAETRLFLAFRDGVPVGRVAAIHSRAADRKYGTKNLRFGWFECVEDYDVARSLFDAAEGWGRELGMQTITGPQGFSDLDPQGMLIEGFDQMPTIAGYYNPPYYPRFVERYGFVKEIDYVEFKTPFPRAAGIPATMLKLAERVRARGRFRVLEFPNRRALLARGMGLFRLLDEAFEELHGSVPLTETQMRYYIGKYFSFVHKDLVKIVVDEKDEIAGFLITMPSLSRAFQHARGRLFPFGWLWILRGLRSRETLDFYLAGVKKSYRGLGVDLLMVVEIIKTGLRMGFQNAESNQELETNTKIQAQWKSFNPVLHKRRRIFRKALS